MIHVWLKRHAATMSACADIVAAQAASRRGFNCPLESGHPSSDQMCFNVCTWRGCSETAKREAGGDERN
jgi:hypothetical protein